MIKFSSLHNKFAMRNYFTFDFPIANFTVRAGYLNSMYRTDVNGIKTHVLSNSFMIGLVKEFYSFGGKRLKKQKHKSTAVPTIESEMKLRILYCLFLAVILLPACEKADKYNPSPRDNFEALWRILDENYCFFEFKKYRLG